MSRPNWLAVGAGTGVNWLGADIGKPEAANVIIDSLEPAWPLASGTKVVAKYWGGKDMVAARLYDQAKA